MMNLTLSQILNNQQVFYEAVDKPKKREEKKENKISFPFKNCGLRKNAMKLSSRLFL